MSEQVKSPTLLPRPERCRPAWDCPCRRCSFAFQDRRRRAPTPVPRRAAPPRDSARCRDRDRAGSSERCRKSTGACRSRDRCDWRNPGMSRSLPVPTITWLSMMIGAIDEMLLIEVRDLDLPLFLSSARVELDQIVVVKLGEDEIAPHADATMTGMRAAARLPVVLPEDRSIARIHRPHVVRVMWDTTRRRP